MSKYEEGNYIKDQYNNYKIKYKSLEQCLKEYIEMNNDKSEVLEITVELLNELIQDIVSLGLSLNEKLAETTIEKDSILLELSDLRLIKDEIFIKDSEITNLKVSLDQYQLENDNLRHNIIHIEEALNNEIIILNNQNQDLMTKYKHIKNELYLNSQEYKEKLQREIEEKNLEKKTNQKLNIEVKRLNQENNKIVNNMKFKESQNYHSNNKYYTPNKVNNTCSNCVKKQHINLGDDITENTYIRTDINLINKNNRKFNNSKLDSEKNISYILEDLVSDDFYPVQPVNLNNYFKEEENKLISTTFSEHKKLIIIEISFSYDPQYPDQSFFYRLFDLCRLNSNNADNFIIMNKQRLYNKSKEMRIPFYKYEDFIYSELDKFLISLNINSTAKQLVKDNKEHAGSNSRNVNKLFKKNII